MFKHTYTCINQSRVKVYVCVCGACPQGECIVARPSTAARRWHRDFNVSMQGRKVHQRCMRPPATRSNSFFNNQPGTMRARGRVSPYTRYAMYTQRAFAGEIERVVLTSREACWESFGRGSCIGHHCLRTPRNVHSADARERVYLHTFRYLAAAADMCTVALLLTARGIRAACARSTSVCLVLMHFQWTRERMFNMHSPGARARASN